MDTAAECGSRLVQEMLRCAAIRPSYLRLRLFLFRFADETCAFDMTILGGHYGEMLTLSVFFSIGTEAISGGNRKSIV